MSTTVVGQAAETLSAGEQLTVSVGSSSEALVERYKGDTFLDKTSITTGSHIFGEYLVDVSFVIVAISGTVTYAVTQNTGQVLARATQTNDDAAAGAIGELLTSTVAAGSAVALTTATGADVTTLALTPGDWDVSAVVDRVLTGTTATQFACGISLTADTMPSQAGGSGLGTDPAIVQTATFGTTISGNYAQVIPPVRVSIAANTTLHLVADDTFSAGTVAAFGTIRARRVR